MSAVGGRRSKIEKWGGVSAVYLTFGKEKKRPSHPWCCDTCNVVPDVLRTVLGVVVGVHDFSEEADPVHDLPKPNVILMAENLHKVVGMKGGGEDDGRLLRLWQERGREQAQGCEES